MQGIWMVFVIFGYLALVGGVAMNWIDHWSDQRFQDIAVKKQKVDALVLCQKEQREIREALIQRHIQVEFTHDLLFKKDWKDITYLIAASDNDADNLSFCNIGKKLYQPTVILSVCNEVENQRLFDKTGIRVYQDFKDVIQEVAQQ